MSTSLPKVSHTYQNHTVDSTRWAHYQPRPDDIIVTTYSKSGTHWMLGIVRQLVFLDQADPQRHAIALGDISPWLERRTTPLDEVLAKLEAQQHRRFILSHLALDGLPYFPEVKYIVVGRDARDVGMSLWDHYRSLTPEHYALTNNYPDLVGDPLPVCPQDIHVFWRDWITRGWFEWESEGYPLWGNLYHTQSWWQFRHLENILFVHYNDLLANLPGEIQRVADFLNIVLPTSALPAMLEALTLDSMRSAAEKINPGATVFFFKGTNGRWKGVLSAEELTLYEETAARVLTPQCRQWLEQGRAAFS